MSFVSGLTSRQQFLTYVETLTNNDRAHGEGIRTFCWQGFHDTEDKVRKERFVTVKGDASDREVLGEEIRQMEGANVEGFCISVAVQEMGVEGDFSGRRRKANVSRIRAQVVDVDKFLEGLTIDKIIEVTKPTMVVLSSRKGSLPFCRYKAHFYFCYGDNDGFSTFEEQIKRYELFQLVLAERVEEVAEVKDRGYTDAGIGIEKALRAPGFKHQKNPESVFTTELYWNDPDATIDDLDQFFKERGITEHHVELARARKEKEREARKKARAIIDHARAAKASGMTGDDLNELIWESNLDSYEGVSEGSRQLAMKHFITGLILVQGLGFHAALALAVEANAKNVPPLEEGEVENLVEYFVNVKAQQLVGEAQDRFIEGVRPPSVAEQFEKHKVAPDSEVLREIEEKEGIPVYDYSDPTDFVDVLSDLSILARLHQKAAGRVIGNKRFGVMVYKDEVGHFCEDEGHVGDMIDEIVAKMPLEQVVQDQFICTRVDKETKEEEFYVNQKQLRKWIEANRAVTKCKPRIAHIPNCRKFIVGQDVLDTHPTLINSPSGVVDLVTGELLPHSPSFLMTRSLRFGYTEGSFEKYLELDTDDAWLSPENGGHGNIWTNFIYEIMGGDLELCGFLQRALGYSMKGSLEAQVLFFFYGQGDNGKSLCLETVLDVMGSYGAALDNMVFLEKKFASSDNARLSDLASMRGARFALSNEIEEGDRLLESAIKDITTGAKITGKFSHKDTIKFAPQFTSFLQGNNRPRVKGNDRGIWRRILEVPFKVSFENRKDPFLKGKLLAVGNEIVSWMVAGAVEYHRIGLTPPEAVLTANQEYRDEMHPEELFYRECLRPCEAGEDFMLTTLEIHKCLKIWWTETNQAGVAPNASTIGRFLSGRTVLVRTNKVRGYRLKFTPTGQEFFSRTRTSVLFQ